MTALPVALAVKTLSDVVINLQLATEEWSENKKFCAYCQSATLASVASLAIALYRFPLKSARIPP